MLDAVGGGDKKAVEGFTKTSGEGEVKAIVNIISLDIPEKIARGLRLSRWAGGGAFSNAATSKELQSAFG